MAVSEADKKLFKEKFKAWKADWNLFAIEVLKVKLDDQQKEILMSIQLNRRISVCSGTARGKDFLAATASICFLYLAPYWDDNGIFQSATVISTGPTDRQVRNIMTREMKSRYNGSILPKLKQFGFDSGRLVGDGIKFDMPKSLEGRAEYTNMEKWYALNFKASNDNAEAWQGFHNTNIFIAVTEASGIADLVWNGVEGCLQGNSKLLIVHNPGPCNGEAFRSMSDPQYKAFRLNSLSSPNVILGTKLKNKEITEDEYNKQFIPGQVDRDWLAEKVAKMGWTMQITEQEVDKSKHDFFFEDKWYRPSDVCKIKILGVHPENSEDTLIPLSWIEAAQQRWMETKKPEGVKAIRGVDVAGMGSDTTVFADKYNDYIDELHIPITFNPATVHMELAGKIKQDANSLESIIIDCIGEGAGVFSRLKEQGVDNAYNFKNSLGAKGLTDRTEARKFLNMRAYTYWALRDTLNPQFDSKLCLPPDDELKAQLAEIKYFIRSDGKIQIESKDDIKKRMGVSTDKADAVAQLYAPIDRLIAAIQKKISRPRPGAFGG